MENARFLESQDFENLADHCLRCLTKKGQCIFEQRCILSPHHLNDSK